MTSALLVKANGRLERAQVKLKKSLENLPFGIDLGSIKPAALQPIPGAHGFISIFGRCEGFTYYLESGKQSTKPNLRTD